MKEMQQFTPKFQDIAPTTEQILPLLLIARAELVARTLMQLWHELKLDGEPLLFYSPEHGDLSTEFHPLLLDQMIADRRKYQRDRFGQLVSWQNITPPDKVYGIAEIPVRGSLLKSDLMHLAEPGDRRTLPAAPYGWFRYYFASGFSALAVHFRDPDDDNDSVRRLVILPHGRHDEWLAFLKLLDAIHMRMARKKRRGRIEIIGSNDDLVKVIEGTSYSDVVLPDDTLAQIKAQRRIFDPKILRRYATLRVPRLRKVLLIGPPGTGKTTLLKAEGAYHAKQGGLVIYVCAPPKGRGSTSWQHLSYALRSSAESGLPTLVLVEDFEMFVSDMQELQLVLNTLDGITTPDNPRGTLLLATSNDPERIDQRIRDRPGRVDMLIEIGLVEQESLAIRFLERFLGSAYRAEEHASMATKMLGQPGSHFREVCIAGAMRALDEERTDVLRSDLEWANEMILNGRHLASQTDRFAPASARKRGGYFGKNR